MQLLFAFLLLSVSGLNASLDGKSRLGNDCTVPNNRVVEGDIFIVPNSASRASEFCEGCGNSLVGGWQVLNKNGGKVEVAKTDYCVEVWLTSKDVDDVLHPDRIKAHLENGVSCNWACHGHPELGSYVSVHSLPYEAMLKDKKEGDIIEFDYQNKETKEIFTLRLTCRQSAYRYRYRCGNFQDCVEEIIKSAKEREEY